MIEITLEEMKSNSNDFKTKFTQALGDGFFYIEIPETLKNNIPEVVQYTNTLRNNESLKAAQLGARLGYQEKPETQVASFSALGSDQWNEVFPPNIIEVSLKMHGLALDVLKTTLTHLNISEDVWSTVTGNITDGGGSNVFSLNHFKPGIQKLGLIPHKDMGWITIIFTEKAGLETSLDGKEWAPIPVREGFFVVNFGRVFEILINSRNKLIASLHRVNRLTEERVSFGIFLNHAKGTFIHQFDHDQQKLICKGTYEEYLASCFKEFDDSRKELA